MDDNEDTNEKQPFKPRESKNSVPLGWTPTDIRGKKEWRCKDVQFIFLFNEYRRCSHTCEKKNIFRHKRHVYKIAQKDDKDFPKKILKKIQNITYHEFNKRYLYQLAMLCGRIDISFQKAVSDAMRNFTLFLLNEGFNFGRNIEYDKISIEKSLAKVSIQQLSNQLIEVAQNEFATQIHMFEKKKFCALLCDAGTVLKTHCLHFILTLVGDPVLKLFFDSYDGDSFDSEFYHNCFFEVFQKLRENNIYICSLTSDSLPAQVKGWKTFLETSTNPMIKAIYRIPCFGHMLNLVYKDIVRESELLCQTISIILSIVQIIRKPQAIDFIGSKCPTVSKTRWLYIVDILLFLLDKRDKINNYLQIQSSDKDDEKFLIDENMEFAYKLLVILKMFSLVVEKDSFQLFNIVPLMREFFSEINMLYSCIEKKEWRDIISITDASMRIRLKKNAYSETITSYALSGAGRSELRKKYISIRTKNGYALSLSTPIESLKNERIKFEHKHTPLYTGELPLESDCITIEDNEEEEELDIESAIKDILEDQDEISLELHELIKTPFEERICKDPYQNIYHESKTELISVGSLIDIPQQYIEEKFDEFLFDDPINLDFIKYTIDPPYLLWQKAYCYDQTWEIFSELALRFSCSFSSETIVERYLSIQKCIQNDKMTNISLPVVKARLQLHETSIK